MASRTPDARDTGSPDRAIAAAAGLITYDPARGVYVLPGGRVIPRAVLPDLLEQRITAGFEVQAALIAPLLDGRITVAEWQQAMAVELRRVHLQALALGAGGWEQVTPAQWQQVADRLVAEWGYLAAFASEMAGGDLSEAQIRMRMELYEQAPWSTYWAGTTAVMAAVGFTEERRVLGHAEHCADCETWASFGWQPLGTLPEPGEQSVCRSNCRCHKEYR